MASNFDTEMGRALCDRLGLGHDTTLREWKAEAVGTTNMIAVSMTTMVTMTQEEYQELRQVAIQRAKEQAK